MSEQEQKPGKGWFQELIDFKNWRNWRKSHWGAVVFAALLVIGSIAGPSDRSSSQTSNQPSGGGAYTITAPGQSVTVGHLKITLQEVFQGVIEDRGHGDREYKSYILYKFQLKNTSEGLILTRLFAYLDSMWDNSLGRIVWCTDNYGNKVRDVTGWLGGTLYRGDQELPEKEVEHLTGNLSDPLKGGEARTYYHVVDVPPANAKSYTLTLPVYLNNTEAYQRVVVQINASQITQTPRPTTPPK